MAGDGLTNVALAPSPLIRTHMSVTNPIDHPRRVDPNIVIRANNKVIGEEILSTSLTETITDQSCDSRGKLLSADFKVPVTLTMPFTDADNDGNGRTIPIRADNLPITT